VNRQGVEEAAEGAVCHGPISQAQFLEGLGIRERLAALLENASEDEGQQLISGYERLVCGQGRYSPDSDDEVNRLGPAYFPWRAGRLRRVMLQPGCLHSSCIFWHAG
jgi:hypothetical protein